MAGKVFVMSKIVILADKKVISNDRRLAGPQIRVVEMARALERKKHEVIVAEPERQSCSEINGIKFIDFQSLDDIKPVDVWITHPSLVEFCYTKFANIPLVVDGYDIDPIESLKNRGTQNLEESMYGYHELLATYLRALKRADKVLCSNERQKIYYLSILNFLGRINPKFQNDSIVLTLPSGTSRNEPISCNQNIIGNVRKNKEDYVVLWAGGIYPWYDIDTFLSAMQIVLNRMPNTQFLFVGVENPIYNSISEMGVKKLVENINASQYLKSHSLFVKWLPYNNRAEMYLKSDIGVSTHNDSLESIFSMRTRVIDMIWGGLPIVLTSGDTMSKYVKDHHIGVTVKIRDPVELANAIISLLKNRNLRKEMSRRERQLSQGELSWDNVIEPLHRFCLDPYIDKNTQDKLINKTMNVIKINDRMIWNAERLSWKVKKIIREEGLKYLTKRALNRLRKSK